MPVRTIKSQVPRTTTKKSGFVFRWWMGLGLVIVAALIDVLVHLVRRFIALVLARSMLMAIPSGTESIGLREES